MNHDIRIATSADTGVIAAHVGNSFADLDVCRWLVHNPGTRIGITGDYFGLFIELAVLHGTNYTLTDSETGALLATATWIDRTTTIPDPADYDERLAQLCGASTPRFETLDVALDKHHPHEPHHHLAFLAVHPDHQSKGLGSALMDHHHKQVVDAAGACAYLEAASKQSVPLYTRHGYEVTGTITVAEGAELYSMWRKPRA